MGVNIAQQLADHRRSNPPSVYNATTKETAPISSDTEDALILVPAESKRKAIEYIDALLDFDPQSTPRDQLIKEAVEAKTSDINAIITELSTAVDDYESFKEGISTVHTWDADFSVTNVVDGMAPLINSLVKGIKTLTDQNDEMTYMKKTYSGAEDRYTHKISSDLKKEWRSWKRVLATYMV